MKSQIITDGLKEKETGNTEVLRVANRIATLELIKDFEDNVLQFLYIIQNKTVLFDLDGTLTAFQYGDGKILPCKENELAEYSVTQNIYKNARALKIMQLIISLLNPDDVYVITNSYDAIRVHKNRFIAKYFPSVKEDHIIHTSSASDKVLRIQEIYMKHKRKIVFVEDMSSNIQLAEETLDYVEGYHISRLLP